MLVDTTTQEYQEIGYSDQEALFMHDPDISFSPTGNTLAELIIFPVTAEHEHYELEIRLRDLATNKFSTLEKLMDQNATGFLNWAPDGGRFVWLVRDTSLPDTEDENKAELWTANAQTGEVKILSSFILTPGSGSSVSWAPDGNAIATIQYDPAHPDVKNIFLVDPNQVFEPPQITNYNGTRISGLSWSLDSQWIAFSIPKEGHSEIWVVSKDGQQLYPLIGPAAPFSQFVWLP